MLDNEQISEWGPLIPTLQNPEPGRLAPVFVPDRSEATHLRRMVYLAGSLRNGDNIRKLALDIRRGTAWEPFVDWLATHPDADDSWRDHELQMGRGYVDALRRPAAQNIFEFDKRWIMNSEAMVLVLPAGKSAHMELGWAAGKGKRTAILLDDPDRWDVMYQFADLVTADPDQIKEWLG